MNIPLDNLLIIDIETVLIEPDFEKLSIKKKAAWKFDSVKYEAEAVFHAEYSKIVCVSFMAPSTNKLISFCGEDEYDILMKVRGVMNNAMRNSMILSGFGIDKFDIPFIFKRSYINNIQPSQMIMYWDKKPWDIKTYDLMKMWSNTLWDQNVSLAVLAETLGVKHLKDVTDGADVKTYYSNGEFSEIQSYCESDVSLVYDCIFKIRHAQTEPDKLYV